MISEEDYSVVTTIDTATPEQRARFLQEKPYLVRYIIGLDVSVRFEA